MKVIQKYACEHCGTIFHNQDRAEYCESMHILYGNLQIVRGIHQEVPPATQEFGQWPSSIIVGLDNNRDAMARYKYECEEEHMNMFNDFLNDSYYNEASK